MLISSRGTVPPATEAAFRSFRPGIRAIAAGFVLALACWFLHGHALNSGWFADDVGMLHFAAVHSPWQYFALPEVMRQQSYAHIAPWAALFFDIGLPWAGLDPRGHHLHLLAVVWAVGLATWLGLRRWLGDLQALAAALLWLATPVAASLAHYLMTAHYAYGLLFSILALASFGRALETGRRRERWLAAACYAAACLCKELYVPLPLLLLAWPRGAWRERWRAAHLVLAVAVAYTALRLVVFGGPGGYAALAVPDPALHRSAAEALRAFALSLAGAFGMQGLAGVALTGVVLASALAAWRLGYRPPALAWAAGAVVVLLPIAPLFAFPVPLGTDRIWAFGSWLGAVAFVGLLRSWRWWWVAPALVLPPIGLAGWHASERLAAEHGAASAELAFITQAGATDRLVPAEFRGVGYLLDMADTVQRVEHRAAPAIVEDVEALLALEPGQRAAAFTWDPAQGRIAPLGERQAALAGDLQRRLTAGAGRPLVARLELRRHGRLWVFRWDVRGSEGRLWFDIARFDRVDAPLQGALPFGLDATAPLKAARTRLTLETPDGAWIRSPLLDLRLDRDDSVEWRSGPPEAMPSSQPIR